MDDLTLQEHDDDDDYDDDDDDDMCNLLVMSLFYVCKLHGRCTIKPVSVAVRTEA